jgi:phage-related minor tail protein
MTMGLTVPITAAVYGLGRLIEKTLVSADNLQTMSDVTGLSTERLQELTYVGTKLDVELDRITGAQRFLTKAMEAAQNGTKAQVAVFEDLGITVTNSSGSLKDSNVIFLQAIDALSKMTNPTERDAASLKLFGKSALELNPLIKAGSTEIAKLTAEARKNGAVMSGASVKALDEFKDSMDAAKISLQTAASQIIVGLLPSLDKLLKLFQEKGIPAIKGFIAFIVNLIDGFTRLSPAVQGIIIGVVAFTAAVGPLLTAVGTLIKVVGSLTSPLGLVVAGIGLVVGAIVLFSGTTDEAVQKSRELAAAVTETTKAKPWSFD